MRITKTNSSMFVAMSVLKKMHIESKRVIVKPYVNGREQGLFVYFCGGDWTQERAVSFAENRNSDDIIVQFGVRSDFDECGVFKTDAMYKTNKAYFGADEYARASKFIDGWLNGLVRKVGLDYRGHILKKFALDNQ